MRGKNSRGFLVLEVLIAGLILTASIASAMYLFRMGFDHMERVNNVNLLSAKLLQAGSLLKIMELERQSGTEELGDGVIMKWEAHLIARNNQNEPGTNSFSVVAVKRNSSHDLFLYRVEFLLEFKGSMREYHINVFRSRPLYWR
jgi:Tfp pilus assembly protein PilV